MTGGESLDYFIGEEVTWLEKAKNNTDKYRIVVDIDCVYVETTNNIPECVFTFSSYGQYFIHALLAYLNVNVEHY